MLKSCYLLLPRLFRSFLQVSSTKELSLKVWRWSSVIMTPHDRTSWGFLKILCITSPNRKSSENSSWLCNSVYYWVAFCLYRSLLKRKRYPSNFWSFWNLNFYVKYWCCHTRYFGMTHISQFLTHRACWTWCCSLTLIYTEAAVNILLFAQ